MRTSMPFRVLLVSLTVFTLTFVVSHRLRATDDIQWKQIGPGGGGNMLSSGVSPANANVVLMGGDVGGILRSGDGGLTWTLANQAMIDPARFLGYGAYGHFEWDTVSTNIVYKGHMKSTDSGVSFKVNIDESDITANSALVDAANHLIVYAHGYGNIYRSSDGFESTSCVNAQGVSCSPQAPLTACQSKTKCYQRTCLPDPVTGIATCPNYNDDIRDMVRDPTAPTHLIACARTGLYKSDDGATTWTKMPLNGLPFSNCQALVLNYKQQGQVRTLYALLETQPIKGPSPEGVWTDVETWQGGVYKSTNWGAGWTEKNGTDEANILVNPGFETAGDAQHPAAGWLMGGATVTRDTVEHHGGNASLKVVFNGDGGGVETDPRIAVQGGELYKISAWIKSDLSIGYPINNGVWFYDAQGQPLEFPGVNWNFVTPITYHAETATSFGWRKMETMFRVPDLARSMNVTFAANYGSGTAWFDDVSMAKTHTLAKATGSAGAPYFASYYDIAVDPTDANVAYVGTERGTWSDYAYADQGGTWKTSDGGTTWTLVTRSQWHDNLRDSSVPECGDNVCGGKWETCQTCPVDCTGMGKPTPPACCGDGTCAAPTENYDNCLADCPFDPDPNHGAGYEVRSFFDITNGNTYYAARGNGNGAVEHWTISTGSGTAGHLTIYVGGEHLKSTDGGATWTEMSTMPYTGGDSQAGTAQARGDTNDIYGLFVTTDTRSGLNRLYFGDTDGLLQVSYNGGKSFAQEGWQWPPWNISPWAPSAGVVGDAASSIVLDDADPNTVYVGVGAMAADAQGYGPSDTCCGGAVVGTFTPGTPPAVGRWAWTPLGNQSTFPKSIQGAELLRTTASPRTFYAAVFARGVYKLDATNNWVNTWDGNTINSNWNPAPSLWLNYRMVEEPVSGRLYVGFGHQINLTVASGESGVWESADHGATWHRITDPSDNTGTGIDQESVMDMTLNGPNTLFVTTWYGYHNGCSTLPCPSYNGDGGIYKGTRDTGTGLWSWTKVLSQPLVSGIAVSPASSSILYAFVGQVCCSAGTPGQQAGIYKSVNGGNTWSLLTNNGLMNIGVGRLNFSSSATHKMYASTIGDGIFEGTISCGPASEGFADADGDGVPDCAFTNIAEQVTPTTGFIIAGNYPALSCATLPDSEEKLREQTTGSKRKLIKVWKFDNVPVGKQFELWVDGYRTPGGGGAADDFLFSMTTKPAGSSCTNSDGAGSTLLTLTNQSNNNQAQIVSIGVVNNPVVCLRVQDGNQNNDSQTDDLTLDRVCLRGLP